MAMMLPHSGASVLADWLNIIKRIAPKARPSIARGLADAMPEIVVEYDVSTPLRQAHFLAQCAHESDGFHTPCEYASGAAYEGRKDLGNTKRGDGKRFKGRGLIQTTGRANYTRVSQALGVDFVAKPEELETFPHAALSAAFFWRDKRLNALADMDDVRKVTKRVNGGYNGLKDRTMYLARAKVALGVDDAIETSGPDAEPLPREKVKALQERLTALGYRCGSADGVIGTATVGAISSFQHDNGLEVSGRLDAATEEKLWHSDAEEKPVPEVRAEGKPDASRIVDSADVLQKGAGAAAAGGGVIAAVDPIKKIEGAGEVVTRVQDAVSPFKPLLTFAQDHWYVWVALAAVAVWFVASRIKQARVDDHRSGKTL